MPEMTETKNLPEATITDVEKDVESDTDSEDTIPELEDPGKIQREYLQIHLSSNILPPFLFIFQEMREPLWAVEPVV